MALKRFWTLFS